MELDAVIVGLGASAQDWAPGRRTLLIGLNDIGRWLTPHHLVVVDAPKNFNDERRQVIADTQAPRAWIYSPVHGDWVQRFKHKPCTETFKINDKAHTQGDYTGTDLSKGLPHVLTTASSACSIAFWKLGLRRLGIIGVDVRSDHELGKSKNLVNTIDKWFAWMRFACESEGGCLVNLSKLSMLHSLPRVSA